MCQKHNRLTKFLLDPDRVHLQPPRGRAVVEVVGLLSLIQTDRLRTAYLRIR